MDKESVRSCLDTMERHYLKECTLRFLEELESILFTEEEDICADEVYDLAESVGVYLEVLNPIYTIDVEALIELKSLLELWAHEIEGMENLGNIYYN